MHNVYLLGLFFYKKKTATILKRKVAVRFTIIPA